MTNVPSLSMPARLVLGCATFQDSTKPDVGVFDVLYRHPHAGLVADGMGVILAEDFPLALTGDKARRLPGLSFGDAVLRALPRDAIVTLTERRGQELSEEEVRQLLLPLFHAAASGEVVVAGVLCPPAPDPQYVPFASNMLPHWRFIPGRDVAEPRIPAANAYMSVRVFTAMEWVSMEATGRRLRAQWASTLQGQNIPLEPEQPPFASGFSGRPTSSPLISEKMKERASQGQLASTLEQEACFLSGWLAEQHPHHPQAKPKTIKNSLRAEYRSLKASP